VITSSHGCTGRLEAALARNISLLWKPGLVPGCFAISAWRWSAGGSKIDVHRGNEGTAYDRTQRWAEKSGRPFTLGYNIFLPSGADDPAVLAHEVTHVIQFERWGEISALVRGGLARLQEFLGGNPYSLPNPFTPGRAFGSYSMEQQGQIVQNCFAGNIGGACGVSPYRPNP
jgi:hypothetical protein